MAKKSDSYIDQIPAVVNGLKVEKWLRRYTITSLSSMRFMPQANKRYRDAIRELSEDDWECYFASLSTAHARSKAQSDFMGVIAIPLVLAFVSFYMAAELEVVALFLIFAFMLVYFISYFYYRILAACIEALLDTARLIRGVL